MPESPDVRRKRLLFRSRQRGMLETNLLLARFAEKHLATLDADGLDRFEVLLEESDADLWDWIAGKREPPPGPGRDLIVLIKKFRDES